MALPRLRLRDAHACAGRRRHDRARASDAGQRRHHAQPAERYPFPGLCKSPRELGGVGSAEIIVYVADPDAHYRRAVAAGAQVVIAIEDKPYGGRGYSCKDPEGHVWAFGSYNAWSDA